MATPSATPWRSLYRSLLRECTYLPDPIAQRYMHRYVRRSFQAHRPPKWRRKPASTPPEELSRLHKSARKLLSLLRRAAEGYLKPLERVLYLSYGRIGRRRRELLQPLLYEYPAPEQPHASSDTADPSPRSKPVRIKPNFRSDDFKAPQTILSILQSQLNQRHIREARVRPILKTPEPRIPELNAWSRPVPVRRKVNIRKRWYAKALDSIFPFLPEDELAVLRGLAAGTESWSPPVRRKVAGFHPQDEAASSALTAEFLVHGASKGPTFERYARGRPHHITRRLMGKMWARVYMLVPRMEWNEVAKKYVINWGLEKLPRRIAYMPNAQKAGWLFDGLDRNGKAPQKKRKAARVNDGASTSGTDGADGANPRLES